MALLSGLVELVIFIVGIPLAIWWLWQRRDWVEQQRRSNNPKLQALVRAALVTFLAFAALIVLIALLGVRWGTGLVALAIGIWWLVTRKSRRHKRERARWLPNNAAAIAKFGHDKEVREAKIDEIFDAKLATIEFDLYELKD